LRATYNFISIDIPSYSVIEATEVAVTQVNYLIWLGVACLLYEYREQLFN